MARLAGKVALVSGGAQGIGEATIRRFAQEGCKVVIGDIQQERGKDLAQEIGADALFVALDVTQLDQWDAAVATTLGTFGRLDILVNNAGGSSGAPPFEEETLEAHQRTVDLNLTGVWAGMRAVIKPMAAQGGGSIVNISSIDGIAGVSRMTTYVATKFAVTGMTKSVALEVGDRGIRVNSVHPGIIGTPLVNGIPPVAMKRLQNAIDRQPLPRIGRPEEIANAALFFASDESSYCTGTSLIVDGGHLAGPYREPMNY